MAGFSDLPEELVFKILVLLPVDSLLCSKFVQKSWYSLITNSRFVVKHLRNQIRNKNSCALVISRPISFDISEANGLFFHFCDCNHIFTVGKIIEYRWYEDKPDYKLVGHCHGIVCFALLSGRVVLANPAIREFRHLREHCYHSFSYWMGCVGFGYDVKSNDYKVVRILCISDGSGLCHLKVEVYTLSADCWRELVANIDFLGAGTRFLKDNFECQYFRGACYWISWDKSVGINYNNLVNGDFIFSFDMSDEVFQKLPVPNILNEIDQEFSKLTVLNESLAFVLRDKYRKSYEIQIWVMDEFGANEIWKKLFTTEPFCEIKRPLSFCERGELIMEDYYREACSYNLGTKEIKKLPVLPCTLKIQDKFGTSLFDFRLLYVVNYMSSLVSVRGGHKLIT